MNLAVYITLGIAAWLTVGMVTSVGGRYIAARQGWGDEDDRGIWAVVNTFVWPLCIPITLLCVMIIVPLIVLNVNVHRTVEHKGITTHLRLGKQKQLAAKARAEADSLTVSSYRD